MHNITYEDLLRLLIAGDESAHALAIALARAKSPIGVQAIFMYHEPYARRTCQTLCRQGEDVSEYLNQALLDFHKWEHLSKLGHAADDRPEAKCVHDLRSLVVMFVRNARRSYWKKKGRKNEIPLPEQDTFGPAKESNIEELAIVAEAERLRLEARQHLGPPDSDVIEQQLKGLSIAESATELGTTPAKIKALRNRAAKRLRAFLDRKYGK